jgi:hypothetical protein
MVVPPNPRQRTESVLSKCACSRKLVHNERATPETPNPSSAVEMTRKLKWYHIATASARVRASSSKRVAADTRKMPTKCLRFNLHSDARLAPGNIDGREQENKTRAVAHLEVGTIRSPNILPVYVSPVNYFLERANPKLVLEEKRPCAESPSYQPSLNGMCS